VLIVTIISSHLLVSRQIRKTKRSDWIESLRKLIAEYIAKIVALDYKSRKSDFEDLTKCSTLLILMLNKKDKNQEKLIEKVAETMVVVSKFNNLTDIKYFEDRVPKIIELAKKIIDEETRKL
jgi:hypothetical protein